MLIDWAIKRLIGNWLFCVIWKKLMFYEKGAFKIAK